MTLRATLDLAAAAAVQWDAVVIGAGVAGSVAARELTRLGCQTLIVDKHSFPRRKVCGSCLNASAIDLLADVGLGETIAGLGGAPLHRLALRCAKQRVDLPVPTGRSISRELLDTALIQSAIEAGAHFLPDTFATITNDANWDRHRRLTLKQVTAEVSTEARVVVLASGLGGQGLPADDEWVVHTNSPARVGVGCVLGADEPAFARGTIWMTVGTRGYVGLVRLEDGRLNVAAALDRDFLMECRTPASAVGRILIEAGLPAPIGLLRATWQGTVTLTRHTTPVASQRVFLIGDAASYVEPFTGEGMAWAMKSGHQVAPWAVRALQGWSSDIESGWARDYRKLVQQEQRTCRALSYLLHNSQLQKLSMEVLSRWPWLAQYAMSK